ncbi:MAG TPA: hypothetical protein VJS69_15200 [Candidatus Krumholzibacteria bacterium]|nr:hypothetical protein [Candidatus Krumholzibacteria bacterium]
MKNTPGTALFVLSPSGPIDFLQEKIGRGSMDPIRWGRRAVAVALFCWLPLLVIALLQPNPNADISFVRDIAVHVRFLLIVPILIFAEGPIGVRSRMVTGQFLESGLIGDEDAAAYEAAMRRGRSLINSWLAEFLILSLSATMVWIAVKGLLLESSSYWFERVTSDGVGLSPAGWWYLGIATPISVFLMLRWLWRCLVWCWFLARVSRMNLKLTGAHPDRMGGLGFITFHQSVFALITFAVGCAISAAFANRIIYSHAELTSYKWPIVGIAAFSVLFGVLPLLVFTPRLARTKRTAWGRYTRFGSDYVWRFEKKWMDPDGGSEEMLGSGDIQSMADLGGTFERMVEMRVFAVDRRTALSFLFAIVGPMLPLLLTMMPLRDIVSIVFKALI